MNSERIYKNLSEINKNKCNKIRVNLEEFKGSEKMLMKFLRIQGKFLKNT